MKKEDFKNSILALHLLNYIVTKETTKKEEKKKNDSTKRKA